MGTMLTMTDGYGKVVKIGIQNGETLHMRRVREKHLYRKENAWCVDKDVFDRHRDIRIFIVEEDDERKWIATREDFHVYGINVQYAGRGEQIALPLDYWEEFK